ncbi:MAG: hypothetical protein HUJ60_00695, partial [Bacilli bacterium]|nr:hypothetical protein [Bacilli bacterium]
TCDEVESGHYPKEAMFPFSGGDTYTRISSTEFVGAIAKAFGYDFKEGKKKFPCRFDAQEKSLIIDLSKEVTS